MVPFEVIEMVARQRRGRHSDGTRLLCPDVPVFDKRMIEDPEFGGLIVIARKMSAVPPRGFDIKLCATYPRCLKGLSICLKYY
jgi:hypothetical protein